ACAFARARRPIDHASWAIWSRRASSSSPKSTIESDRRSRISTVTTSEDASTAASSCDPRVEIGMSRQPYFTVRATQGTSPSGGNRLELRRQRRRKRKDSCAVTRIFVLFANASGLGQLDRSHGSSGALGDPFRWAGTY